MRITLIVLACAVLAAPALGQSSAEGWLVPFAAAFQPPVSGFNTYFARYSMPEARTRHYGWGIELRTLTDNFLIGPMFFKTWDDVENDGWRLRTDNTGIFGEAGLKLAPFDFLYVVPMLGVGGLSYGFNLREKTGDVGLDSLLGSPNHSAVISPGMKLAGLATLELDVAFSTGAGRYGVSLRGGYLYSPFALDWHLANGARVTGAPSAHLGGLFFSVGLLILPEATTSSTPTFGPQGER
jgi:hypothetical protein